MSIAVSVNVYHLSNQGIISLHWAARVSGRRTGSDFHSAIRVPDLAVEEVSKLP